MTTLVRFIRLLAIVVWVGGIIFFAFVLAPVAFHLLPSQHEAGIVVGGTLRVFDHIGLACGGIFLSATLILRRPTMPKRYGFQLFLALVMMCATGYIDIGILPSMERDRVQAGGNIEAAPATDPARADFDRLHKRSEQVEGAVLFCGLGIVLLMARESVPLEAVNS